MLQHEIVTPRPHGSVQAVEFFALLLPFAIKQFAIGKFTRNRADSSAEQIDFDGSR